MISPQERPKPSEILNALQEALKTVEKSEPESPNTQHVPPGFPDTCTESPTLTQMSPGEHVALKSFMFEVPESLQTVGFPVESFSSFESPFQQRFEGSSSQLQHLETLESEPGSPVAFPIVDSFGQPCSFTSPLKQGFTEQSSLLPKPQKSLQNELNLSYESEPDLPTITMGFPSSLGVESFTQTCSSFQIHQLTDKNKMDLYQQNSGRSSADSFPASICS